ncbi:MAG: hypothetical protein JNL94_14435, partial [Planctomycetes bacterium]|nr:hypothetical protein [Planctomycetota bacterium]
MKFQILLSLLFALGISGTAMARQSAPPVLQYQARLLDTLGNPVTASGVVVTFRVYDAPVGGNELFAETQSIDVVGGLLSAPIGSVQPLATTLFSTSANRWLGITVGADTEMTPRQRFGSSAYALRADTARLADDVTGMEIHPASVSIGGVLVIDENGNWVGNPTGLVG